MAVVDDINSFINKAQQRIVLLGDQMVAAQNLGIGIERDVFIINKLNSAIIGLTNPNSFTSGEIYSIISYNNELGNLTPLGIAYFFPNGPQNVLQNYAFYIPAGNYAPNVVFGASGVNHSQGLVPDPGSSAGTTRFLREDATWQIPATSSGVTSFNTRTGAVTLTSADVTTALTFTPISNSLTSAKFLVGNGANIATAVSLGGDASLSNSGALTVTGLKGSVLPSLTAGNLKYNGSAWVFDNATYLATIAGITAGGDLSGTYANPTVAKLNGQLPSFYLLTTNQTEGSNLFFTNARAIGSTLTGYVSGAGTISSSDSILSAIQKLNGNISGLVTGVSSFNTRTGAITLTSSDVTTALTFTPENITHKGVANGYAGLDSSGFVPLAQINPSLIGAVDYQGTWNASTNTPTLASGTGTKGFYYIVSVSGTTTLDGISSWAVGDWVIFNGTTWGKVNNVQGITSFSFTNSGGFTGTVTNSTTTPALSLVLQNASTSQSGQLTSTDWNTFSGKQNALTLGNFTEATSSILTITGGTGAIVGSGLSVQVKQSSTSQSGYLSSTDWTTFNNKLSTTTAASTYLPIANPAYTGVLTTGTLGYADTGILESAQSSTNSYNQIVIQNTNTGAAASSDFVVNNNNSTATTFYGDFGMNSSGWVGSGAFNVANNVYLTSTSVDLAIGTTTANAIHFVANNAATDAMTISSANLLTVTNLATFSSGLNSNLLNTINSGFTLTPANSSGTNVSGFTNSYFLGLGTGTGAETVHAFYSQVKTSAGTGQQTNIARPLMIGTVTNSSDMGLWMGVAVGSQTSSNAVLQFVTSTGFVNINCASAIGNGINLQYNGSTQISVSSSGVTISSSVIISSGNLSANSPIKCANYLSLTAGGNVLFGGQDQTATSNVAGGTATLQAGKGTGTATPPKVFIQGPTVTTSGSTLQSLVTLGTFDSVNGNIFFSTTTTQPTLIARGIASQSVSLQEWQNSSLVALAKITSAGDIQQSGGLIFINSVPSGNPSTGTIYVYYDSGNLKARSYNGTITTIAAL